MNPLTPQVLAMLKKETGIDSADAWWNIWWLISKPEHDNEEKKDAFEADDGTSLFQYAAALSYDRKERGVTMGIVGFTTACDGKDGEGDAKTLFDIYKTLGGEDLSPLMKGCAKNKAACKKLCKKIKSLGDEPAWVEAQWRALFAPGETGYLRQTMKAWKSIGVDAPSPLAIATVFDASLNQGSGGPDGGCVFLTKLGVRGDEDATLQKYNAWRAKVAGTKEYNEPAINGKNRAGQFESLRKAGCSSLEKCDAEIQRAIGWEMK